MGRDGLTGEGWGGIASQGKGGEDSLTGEGWGGVASLGRVGCDHLPRRCSTGHMAQNLTVPSPFTTKRRSKKAKRTFSEVSWIRGWRKGGPSSLCDDSSCSPGPHTSPGGQRSPGRMHLNQ